MQSAIALLIVGTVIATLGAAAIVVHVFRRRAHERFLLWFGLFSILYGTILVVRTSVFRLGFGQPQELLDFDRAPHKPGYDYSGAFAF